ncbi:MAG: hypothetical protein COA94_05300 [Rickettsiales bacterium]|nr:MAG: hypothetical protein COA94_05300 [Rickettsiales bacterium]
MSSLKREGSEIDDAPGAKRVKLGPAMEPKTTIGVKRERSEEDTRPDSNGSAPPAEVKRAKLESTACVTQPALLTGNPLTQVETKVFDAQHLSPEEIFTSRFHIPSEAAAPYTHDDLLSALKERKTSKTRQESYLENLPTEYNLKDLVKALGENNFAKGLVQLPVSSQKWLVKKYLSGENELNAAIMELDNNNFSTGFGKLRASIQTVILSQYTDTESLRDFILKLGNNDFAAGFEALRRPAKAPIIKLYATKTKLNELVDLVSEESLHTAFTQLSDTNKKNLVGSDFASELCDHLPTKCMARMLCYMLPNAQKALLTNVLALDTLDRLTELMSCSNYFMLQTDHTETALIDEIIQRYLDYNNLDVFLKIPLSLFRGLQPKVQILVIKIYFEEDKLHSLLFHLCVPGFSNKKQKEKAKMLEEYLDCSAPDKLSYPLTPAFINMSEETKTAVIKACLEYGEFNFLLLLQPEYSLATLATLGNHFVSTKDAILGLTPEDPTSRNQIPEDLCRLIVDFTYSEVAIPQSDDSAKYLPPSAIIAYLQSLETPDTLPPVYLAGDATLMEID